MYTAQSAATQKIKIMLQILQTSKTEIKPMSFFILPETLTTVL
jgi:hypothetical protein